MPARGLVRKSFEFSCLRIGGRAPRACMPAGGWAGRPGIRSPAHARRRLTWVGPGFCVNAVVCTPALWQRRMGPAPGRPIRLPGECWLAPRNTGNRRMALDLLWRAECSSQSSPVHLSLPLPLPLPLPHASCLMPHASCLCLCLCLMPHASASCLVLRALCFVLCVW